jgi:hypothetical protein
MTGPNGGRLQLAAPSPRWDLHIGPVRRRTDVVADSA